MLPLFTYPTVSGSLRCAQYAWYVFRTVGRTHAIRYVHQLSSLLPLLCSGQEVSASVVEFAHTCCSHATLSVSAITRAYNLHVSTIPSINVYVVLCPDIANSLQVRDPTTLAVLLEDGAACVGVMMAIFGTG